MTVDPALRFWLRYAETEGALHEQGGAVTTVLLPDHLRAAFDLPEEVAVTADPEVAREDGALLLAPGHPALDAAAQRVLDRGDIGRVTLAWPSALPPSAEALVERLREQVPVDHGRIDSAGEPPVACYLPVLRVGALVTYTLTLDDRFQERQEAWVDATTGLPFPPNLSVALKAAARSEATAHRVLPADWDAAAAAAQGLLERDAGARLSALGRQLRGAREAELARIGDYYQAELESLTRRRATAPADRATMLDARADATRAEWERRLAEVEEKFRGSLDVRWFRAHELLVPAVTVPVTIRRGRREFPCPFSWLLALQTVAPVRCPHCGAGSPLVAGRERLGCARCLPRPTSSPETASAAPAPDARAALQPTSGPAIPPPTPSATASPTPSASRTSTPPRRPPRSLSQRRPPEGSRPVAPSRRAEPVDAPVRDPKRLAEDGNRLGMKFWEDVARNERRIARLVVPGSPAEVTVRLWGARGPAIALGVPAAEQPTQLDARTTPYADAVMHNTSGWLRTEQREYPYLLRWQGGPGRPGVTQVAEVLVGRRELARPSPYGFRSWWHSPSLVQALPRPRIDLDPVAAALWQVELPGRGFPLLLRCLAAWWRVEEMLDADPSRDVAAAVARLVAAAAGTQISIDTVAREYAVDRVAVRAVGTPLRRALQLSPERGW